MFILKTVAVKKTTVSRRHAPPSHANTLNGL